jgi:tetratricopeptide (TPR) repeat protein
LEAGRPVESIPLLEELLRLNEAKRGRADLSTLETATSLGMAYRNAGRLDSAIPLLEETLRLEETALGPDHPATVRCMQNLALAYQFANRFDEAVPLFEGALEHLEATHGSGHPLVLFTMHSLAVAYWSTNQLDRSIPLFEELLRRREATLGRNHPDTLSTAADLGVNYRDAGRLEDAIPLLEEARRASSKHPRLRAYRSHLLDAYVRTADPAKPGDIARVVGLVQETVAEVRTTLPEDSPELAGQLAWLGLVLIQVNAWAEAEPLVRETLTIRQAKEPDDWRTFNTKSMLGGVLLGQARLAEAEPLLLEGYRGMKQREATIPQLPQAQARIPESLERLVRLYEATGNEAEATKWREALVAAKQ